MDTGVPACAFQVRSRDESVPPVITFSREAKAAAGLWKQLLHRACNSGTRVIHERFRRNSFGERGIFRGAHFRGTDDGRVHCSLEVDLGFVLLEDLFFFDFEPLWCLELESRMNR